jgi:hypothetical protein
MRTPTTPTRTARDSCPTRPPRGLAATRPRGLAATVRRRVQVDLTPQAIEQVALRVTQLLRQTEQRTPELMSAGELARHLRVQRPWIYKNRHLLGGQRIGDGPKAPWRFDLDTAQQALQRHQAAQHAIGGQ